MGAKVLKTGRNCGRAFVWDDNGVLAMVKLTRDQLQDGELLERRSDLGPADKELIWNGNALRLLSNQ